VAEAQNLESLIQQGMELFSAKRFQEAVLIFQQALAIEPRHVGAAYMLSIALYFSGSFREADHLLRQLMGPGSPLEPQKAAGLQELSSYAKCEILRQDYWQRLSGVSPKKIARELKRRGWEPASIEAFHLHLTNGAASEWLGRCGETQPGPTVRVTTRASEILILKGCRDADDSIGTDIEAIRQSAYVFLALRSMRIVEMGSLKRWTPAQVELADGRRETLTLPMIYRDSMTQSAHGVPEGIETITQPLEGCADLRRAFGQKQLRSDTGQIGWSRILRLEIGPPMECH
jgi:protein involved in temperature-dependent protein secretion